MKILGIESSCDETAASVVEDGRVLKSNIIFSQADLHKLFGGVVPEVASRKHVEAILPVVEESLADAGESLDTIDAIAVTHGPGLAGALLVGLSAAKGLAMVTQKPLVGVHHIAGHIAANYLEHSELKPPFLSLVVSGGHTQIILVKDYCSHVLLATTRDDAAGEALDKIARAIGLGYPGGPLLDKIAKTGNPEAIRFPKVAFKDSLDFSFSGIKTAGLTYINRLKQQAEQKQLNWEDSFNLPDFAASYQHSIVSALIEHLEKAVDQTGIKDIALAGGVSANSHLRNQLDIFCDRLQLRAFYPSLILCTDNAAMIAAQGYYEYRNRPEGDSLSINAQPNLKLVKE